MLNLFQVIVKCYMANSTLVYITLTSVFLHMTFEIAFPIIYFDTICAHQFFSFMRLYVPAYTLVNKYVDLVVFTRIAGTS